MGDERDGLRDAAALPPSCWYATLAALLKPPDLGALLGFFARLPSTQRGPGGV